MMSGVLDSQKVAQLKTILTQWDIPPVQSIQPVHEHHSVFKITTAGPAFTLKDISDAPNLPRLDFTRDVLKHVERFGLRVPVPILSRSVQSAVLSEGRFYTLSEFIEADEYPSEPELQPDLFYQTGQAIARLHEALAAYPDPEVSRRTWREDLAGRGAEWLAALGTGLPEHQTEIVKRVGRVRGAAIERALRGLPEQLIHRDCHPGNILVRGTRVIGFIDCDHLCIGPRLFDLAYYAVHHLKWETGDEAATQRWLTRLPYLLNGYRSRQSLSVEEVSALPYAMLAYHLLLSDWFIGLAQLDPIAVELRALDWIHTHFDAILNATTSS